MQVAITDAKELQLVAVVTRADGTVEDLGVVAYWHSNPIKRFVWRIKQFFKGN
jgi:hypothetical protein